MQKITYLPEGFEAISPDKFPQVEIPEAELVTDGEEIQAMIRRAVSVSWREQVFPYEELTYRLAINGVALSQDKKSRETFLEESIDDLYSYEVEIAKEAGRPIPVLIRFAHKGIRYDGIATPQVVAEPEVESEPQAAEVVVVELVDQAPRYESLDQADLAMIVLFMYANSARTKPVFQFKEIQAAISAVSPETDARAIKAVLKELKDNQYLETYVTGRKKLVRTWYAMDKEIVRDVREDNANGTLRGGLEYILGLN